MTNTQRRTNEILMELEMHPELTELKTVTDNFQAEMEKGLRGEESSLMMIPTYLQAEGSPPMNEPVIVMDAGGTNFRRALVSFDSGGAPVVDELLVTPMPGSQGELSRDEYLEEVAELIRPLTNKSNMISFCFSYPSHILPNRDGKLTRFSKEVKVRDSEGMIVGQSLLEKLGEPEKYRFVLLNDSVACMLGGVAAGGREYDGLSGIILGTGLNFCYLEKGGKIKKLQDAGNMIINTEAGIFDKVKLGRGDLVLDEKTENPKDHIFEKMVSGAYTGGLITETLRLFKGRDVFSDGFMDEIASCDYLEMPQVDGFIKNPKTGGISYLCKTGSDREALYTVIDAITERAARLICGAIAGIMENIDGGKRPWEPMCMSADGSMFYKSPIFRNKLNYHVANYINRDLGRYIEFVKAENGNMSGSAMAALLN